MFYVFFFQAEDGIRDIGVTGVQTCALPISILNALASAQMRAIEAVKAALPAIAAAARGLAKRLEAGGRLIYAGAGTSIRIRSEERRVGEEGRSRWAPDH